MLLDYLLIGLKLASFHVIGAIYNSGGISRGEVWTKRVKGQGGFCRADLYRLLFHDLSTGRIIRQHRQKAYDGRFIKETPVNVVGICSVFRNDICF